MIPPSDIVHIVIVSDKFFDINHREMVLASHILPMGNWSCEISNILI